MARQDQKTADRRRSDKDGEDRHDSQAWYGGDRENEFGGEGRFRAEGGHGSHFGGEPEALRDDHPDQRNTDAWRGERRKKFMEKFDRWRRERAARAVPGGPGNTPDRSTPQAAGRGAKK